VFHAWRAEQSRGTTLDMKIMGIPAARGIGQEVDCEAGLVRFCTEVISRRAESSNTVYEQPGADPGQFLNPPALRAGAAYRWETFLNFDAQRRFWWHRAGCTQPDPRNGTVGTDRKIKIIL
jgi:hypothetical protein